MSNYVQKTGPGMIGAMKMMFTRITDFKGRSRRSEYWWPVLLLSVIFIIILCGTIASMVATLLSNPATMNDPNAFSAFLIAALFASPWLIIAGLILFVCQLALTVRRLHDVGLSGWWFLGYYVANFIPFLNFVAYIAFIVVLFLDSKPEPNKWGPSPKYEVAE